MGRNTRKTKTKVDDRIIERANRPISLLLFLVGLRFALMPLNLGSFAGYDIESILIKIITSLIILNFFYVVIIVFDIIIDEWGRAFGWG